MGCEGLLQTTGSASLEAKEPGHGREVGKGKCGCIHARWRQGDQMRHKVLPNRLSLWPGHPGK